MKTKSPPRKRPRRGARKTSAAKPPTLRAKLVRIGNSRGVRLPKAVIEQAGLTTDVEIVVQDGRVVIRSAGSGHPRAGWEEQIKKALAEHGEDIDDEWLDEWLNAPLNTEFDEKEWTW